MTRWNGIAIIPETLPAKAWEVLVPFSFCPFPTLSKEQRSIPPLAKTGAFALVFSVN